MGPVGSAGQLLAGGGVGGGSAGNGSMHVACVVGLAGTDWTSAVGAGAAAVATLRSGS